MVLDNDVDGLWDLGSTVAWGETGGEDSGVRRCGDTSRVSEGDVKRGEEGGVTTGGSRGGEGGRGCKNTY